MSAFEGTPSPPQCGRPKWKPLMFNYFVSHLCEKPEILSTWRTFFQATKYPLISAIISHWVHVLCSMYYMIQTLPLMAAYPYKNERHQSELENGDWRKC